MWHHNSLHVVGGQIIGNTLASSAMIGMQLSVSSASGRQAPSGKKRKKIKLKVVDGQGLEN